MRTYTFIALLFLSLPLTSSAETALNESEEKIEIKDLTSISKGRIAFTYTPMCSSPGNCPKSSLYFVDFKKLEVWRLPSTGGNDRHPTWSPDGKKIAFSSDVSGSWQLYTINADGTEFLQLTNNSSASKDPDWHPMKNLLAFERTHSNTKLTDVYVIDTNGKNERKVTDSKEKVVYVNPRWVPKREDKLVYSTNAYWPGWKIVSYELGKGVGRLITTDNASFRLAAVSPKKSMLALVEDKKKRYRIVTQRGGRMDTRQLIESGLENALDPEWVNRGKQVVFVRSIAVGSGSYQLYISDADSGEVKKLLQAPGSIRHPSWTRFDASSNEELNAAPVSAKQ